MNSLVQIDPATYERHAIHGAGRCWAETNCYVDVLVELIHALGFDPVAGLTFAISIDFEIDQWTFFKYNHHDLLQMYGMQVEELNPWLSLAQHVEEQTNGGRPVLVEVDSFYLPDTKGTAYQNAHVKSTIAVNEIDVMADHMGYFHGQGYYFVDGQDFRDLFQIDGRVHERVLPPYIEFMKLHLDPADVDENALLAKSITSLQKHLELLPSTNPFLSFRKRFEIDLKWLRNEPIETFHGYSFATLRQYGACFELVKTYLEWLQAKGESGLTDCINSYKAISEEAKVFQFKLARSLARKKDLDLSPIDSMADLWQTSSEALTGKYL